jgi:hypothetical protein
LPLDVAVTVACVDEPVSVDMMLAEPVSEVGVCEASISIFRVGDVPAVRL